MSDRLSAQINIGGNLPRSLLPGLFAAIESDEAKLDWEENEADSPNDLAGKIDGLESLFLCNGEAYGGIFEEIEAFCVANNLSYARHREGYCEYTATIEWRTPGMRQAADCYANQGGDLPLVAVATLRDILAKHSDTLAVELAALLDANTPPKIPPLVLVD